MDKTSQKVTNDKDPKRVDAGRKGRENVMKKNEGEHFKRCKKGHSTDSSNETTSSITNSSNETTSVTNNASNETISVTNTATTRSNDTYVYGIGIVAVLAIGVCVYFSHITLFSLNFKNLPMIARRLSISKKRSTTKTTSYALDPI